MSLELPNYTLLFQLLFFGATIYTLSRFVFRPLLVVIQERRKRTLEALKIAETVSKEAASALNRYQTKIEQYKDELRAAREEVRQSLAKEEADQLRKIREDFLKITRETKKNIEVQLRKSETALSNEIEELSGEIFKKFSLRGNEETCPARQ